MTLALVLLATLAIPRTDSGWAAKHQHIVEQVSESKTAVLFLGDSLIAGWAYTKYQGRCGEINAGISSDRVEHILWRAQNGLLVRHQPEVIVVQAGANNAGLDNTEALTEKILGLVTELQRQAPSSKIILVGMFPMDRHTKADIRQVNEHLSKDLPTDVIFLNLYDKLADRAMRVQDGVHLSRQGYEAWATALVQQLPCMTENR